MRGEQPVRDGNAQHGSVPLDVQPVAQPQRTELILGQLPREVAPRLIAEFRDPLIDKRLVELVVPVQDRKSTRLNSSHGYISYAVFCLKKKKDEFATWASAPRSEEYQSVLPCPCKFVCRP